MHYLKALLNNSLLQVPDFFPSFSHIQVATCVPSSCQSEDLKIAMTESLEWMLTSTGIEALVQVYNESCTSTNSPPWGPFDKGDVTMLLVQSVIRLPTAIN
jgi:hypothetical protein